MSFSSQLHCFGQVPSLSSLLFPDTGSSKDVVYMVFLACLSHENTAARLTILVSLTAGEVMPAWLLFNSVFLLLKTVSKINYLAQTLKRSLIHTLISPSLDYCDALYPLLSESHNSPPTCSKCSSQTLI